MSVDTGDVGAGRLRYERGGATHAIATIGRDVDNLAAEAAMERSGARR